MVARPDHPESLAESGDRVGHITNRLSAFRDHLSEPISPYGLAVFRILFGLLLLYDVIRYARRDWIQSKYAQPDFLFAYDGFGWLPVLSPLEFDILWLGVGICAALITLGWFTRAALAGFITGYGYLFLLDKAQYMNHHYMVLLFAVLLLVVPASQVLSIDGHRREQSIVRRGHKYLLAAQVEIILIYSGLVKLTPDWLAGRPLGDWLRARSDDVFYGRLFQYDWVIFAGAWGTVALHVIGAPLLLWRRTRIPVFLVYCLFHLSNAQLFQIGIFPYLTIGATTLLFAPDWPVRVLNRLGRIVPALPLMSDPVISAKKKSAGLSTAMIIFAALWLSVQAVLPWRNLLYPGDVHWTGQGHRYSWRMKIYDRNADGVFIVTNRVTGEQIVHHPGDFFTRRQTRKLLSRPDMIVDAAHHIRDFYSEAGLPVEVNARIMLSVNGREPHLFIDPSVDLAHVYHSPFRPIDILIQNTLPDR